MKINIEILFYDNFISCQTELIWKQWSFDGIYYVIELIINSSNYNNQIFMLNQNIN